MNLIQAISFVLETHDRYGTDWDGISNILHSRGIWVSTRLIREIINTLYDHPPRVPNGPVYGVHWSLQGFRLIVQAAAAGETSEQITTSLSEEGYGWSIGLVGELILTHMFWAAWGNGPDSL